jgi:lysyl-tRNA synthetase class 2
LNKPQEGKLQELPDQFYQRLRKLEKLRELGIDPYPARAQRTHSIKEARENFEKDESFGQSRIALAGRLISIRNMGGLTFTHINDGSGKIQLMFRRDLLGDERYRLFLDFFDIGDFIEAHGKMFRTRTGEITLLVEDYRLLAKSLHPLPEKWHGLQDVELRYRRRYLDLLANEEVKEIFIIRSKIIKAMRQFLDSRGFLEVETPILQPIYGGAAARPFETWYHALERSFYLRISDELYLKRLIVGGFEKVYEIGKDFRNEGLDARHNPEFTMMECYQAYADYHDMMRLTEEMIAFIAQETLGTTTITYAGNKIELSPPWPRATMRDLLIEYTGIDFEEHKDLESLREAINRKGFKVDLKPTWGKQLDELFKEYVEPHLIGPIFVMDYPVEISPLAKRKPDAPHLVERFEGFIGGMEIANAFSELNDPLDQRERFLEQAKAREKGDEETHPVDEDFIFALMHGMPPTGGLGVGIDRLTMILTDKQSIREVILFPHLRTT